MVTVLLPGFFIPRIVMHICSASSMTNAPLGLRYSISASAMQRGLYYYDMALRMYEGADSTTEWTDLLGLLAPTETVQQIQEDILSGDISSIEKLEEHMRDIYDSYAQWKGYAENDAEREQATEEWKDAIRRDAEREYDMGDVSDKQLTEFLESL